jgi:predicted alpha/beta hydrolase family esterase
MRQILFVQGAGAGAHDEWDDKLVASLERELGDGYIVRYPRMPREDDPSYTAWGPAIGREVAGLDDGAVVVGHSVGGTLLMHSLTRQPSQWNLGGIVLIAAPFVGAGGWPVEEFELLDDLGARLPQGTCVHVFHGLDDQTVPLLKAQLYARAVGQAQLHLLPGCDHQLNEDLAEVARVVESMATA